MRGVDSGADWLGGGRPEKNSRWPTVKVDLDTSTVIIPVILYSVRNYLDKITYLLSCYLDRHYTIRVVSGVYLTLNFHQI